MKSKKIVLSLICFALIAVLIPGVFACNEGKVTGGGHGKVGTQVRTPAGSFGFNAMWTKKGLKGELQYVDHTTGMKVHAHDLDYLYVYEPNPPNKPYPMKIAEFGGPCTVNGEDGYYFYVYVEDNGEPGKNDKFYIALFGGTYDGYEGGSAEVPILVGNIQIHKPMP
jgi:hypothetical protein